MSSEQPGPFDRILKTTEDEGPAAERDRAVIYVVGTIIGLAILLLVLLLPPVSVLSRGGGDNNSSSAPGNAADYTSTVRGGIPKLPEGLVAASALFDLAAPEDKRGASALTVVLKEKQTEARGLALYTYTDNTWHRLSDVTLAAGGTLARGDVQALPGNVVVLKRSRATLQVAGSIPAGTAIDARGENIVTALHPLVFIATADGGVAGTPPAVPPAPYRVVPAIVALDPAVVDTIIRSSGLRQQHARAIAEQVQQGNFAGIDVDYHSVNDSLRAEFTDFIEKLAAELDKNGRTLTLTLPLPASRDGAIAPGAYDWERLGSLADSIELIGELDQELYFQTSEAALEYITGRVDRNKVLLTLSSLSVERGSDGLRVMALTEALGIAGVVAAEIDGEIAPSATVPLVSQNLAQSQGASGLHWDDTARTVTFSYPGRGGKRTVWIANQFSAAFRIELAQRFGLAGIAISDVSAQGGGADIWTAVQQAADAGTSALSKPNGELLTPAWQAAAGSLSADRGDGVSWSAPAEPGTYEVTMIVSDGVVRAAQRIALDVVAP